MTEDSTKTFLSQESVLFAFLEYLQYLKESGLSEDSVESLEVATQCLSSAFALDMNDATVKSRLSLGQPSQLPQLLALGSLSKDKLAEAVDSLKKKQSELTQRLGDNNDCDVKFGQYLSNLKSKGFFAGTQPGTKEYEDRFLKAREKFMAKFYPLPNVAVASEPKKEPTLASPILSEQDAGKSAEDFKLEGNKLLNEKEYSKAIERYTQAIRLNPKNAIYYSNRAAAYSQMNKHEEAVKDASEAVQIDPNYSKAWGRLGLAHFSLGNWNESVINYEKAVELEPSSESFRNSLEAAKLKVGNSVREQSAPDVASMFSNPDLMNSLGSMFGGSEGLSSILNNPAFQSVANQMASNPQMMNMANSMMQNPEALSGMMNALGGMGRQ